MPEKNNSDFKNGFNLYLLGIKGFEVLKFIIKSEYTENINFVVIGIDKKIENDFSYEIKKLCLKYKIKHDYKNSNKIIPKCNYSIAISWKWIIQDEEFLIVLHDSILPKYRGFLPLVSQLVEGEEIIGVSAIIANENYDEGDIIYVSRIKINYPITIEAAIKKINFCYFDCLKYIFESVKNNLPFPLIKQDHSKATYSLWRDEEDYLINWNWPIKKICRFIDSVSYPYKGAKTIFRNQEIAIEKVKIIRNVYIVNRDNGKFFGLQNNKPIVVCKDGLLLVEKAKYISNNQTIFPIKTLRERFKNT